MLRSDPEAGFDCCVVGAGPAGAVLGLLLARRGLRVVVLEAASDLDREFRGDTLHPSVLEIMDELGLAGALLSLPHSRVHRGVGETPAGEIPFYDFRRLRTCFPFVAMMPQPVFLDFVLREAGRYPGFSLKMNSRVHALLRDEAGAVRGVRYRDPSGSGTIRAHLTVGCDGRGSAVRALAGLEQPILSRPMDVLWFRLARDPADGGAGFRSRVVPGRLFVVVDRGDFWQVGCVVGKGSLVKLRAGGFPAFRESLSNALPELGSAVGDLGGWSDVSVLAVRAGSLSRWWRPGVLLLGDAAHVMSPVGGAGISLAIQDAVAAANRLVRPLRGRRVEPCHLECIERRRLPAALIVQAFQRMVEAVLVQTAIGGSPKRFRWSSALMNFMAAVPGLGSLPTRLVGLGPWREHVDP
jgi:2-polyprenyl-6-methoxyphenol hydroxylase-like FAD-dependent oxidoreductase